MKKNHKGNEKPIYFYRKTLIYSPLKYNIMNKKTYALVQALKEFWVYILHSHIISHVPTSAVKDILTYLDPESRRGKWIAVLLEYELDINPTKIIKIHILAKLMDQSNCDSLSLHMVVKFSV